MPKAGTSKTVQIREFRHRLEAGRDVLAERLEEMMEDGERDEYMMARGRVDQLDDVIAAFEQVFGIGVLS